MKIFADEYQLCVWVEFGPDMPSDFTDADVQHSVECHAATGSETAKRAVRLMAGRTWLDMKWPRSEKSRVYLDGAS